MVDRDRGREVEGNAGLYHTVYIVPVHFTPLSRDRDREDRVVSCSIETGIGK